MKIYGRPGRSGYDFSFENQESILCHANTISFKKAIVSDSKDKKLAKISAYRSKLRFTLGTSFLIQLEEFSQPLQLTSKSFWGNEHRFKYQNSQYYLYAHQFDETSLYRQDIQVAKFDLLYYSGLKKPTIEIDFHKYLDPIFLISISMTLCLTSKRESQSENSISFGRSFPVNRSKYNPDWTAMN